MDTASGQGPETQRSAIDPQKEMTFEAVSKAIEKFTFLKKRAPDAIKNIGDYEEADQAYQGAVDAARKGNKSEATTQGAIVIAWLHDNADKLRKFQE